MDDLKPLRTATESDSMAILLFITLADESFGVTLSPKGIMACKTIDDLFDLVSNGNAH
jgi:hypothetical protein